LLADTLRALPTLSLTDEDGAAHVIELLPPASAADIAALERRLPAPLPPDIRDALLVTTGLADGPLDSFSLLDAAGFGLEDLFPHAYSIAGDGYGNFWLLDLLPGAVTWGPVFYACHDPPVIAYQAATVDAFLRDTIAMWQPGGRSSVDVVHEEATRRIWSVNPLVRTRDQVFAGSDSSLRGFAESLPVTALVADLRNATTGDGFSWGAFGPETVIQRWGTERVWATSPPPKKQGILSRLFRR
jgi:hypothetical protein